MENKKRLGDMGETFAAAILFDKGYSILETKYRCKVGEVDVIAAKDDEVCFVEVKTRQSDVFGRPAESVSREKKRRIRNVAKMYVQQKHLEDRYLSFQVIEIFVNHIENAF